MEQYKRDNLIAIFLSLVLAYLTYLMVLSELPKTLADYNGHTYVYLPSFSKETWFEGWKMVPYCMWHLSVLFFNKLLHIPLETSAAYVSCIFRMLTYFVYYWIVKKATAVAGNEESSSKAAFIAFGLSVSQGIYFHWLQAGNGRFLGMYSQNPIHNPTQMTASVFSLLCLCLVADIWGKQKDDNYHGMFFQVEKGLKKYYIYLAITLALSAMAKPTFAEMFIPTIGILMLWEWIVRIRQKDGSGKIYFRHCLNMFLCAVPSLLYILLQFLAYFIWGGSYGADGGFMITKWLEVWSMYSENVFLSIALGMAFPLFMFLINTEYFLKNDLGRIALTGYIVAFLEAALLGEGGSKLAHSDFIWPLMSAMLIAFTVSMIRLLTLERTQADTKGKRILLNIAWFLFCLHVLCGLIYLKTMILVPIQ